VRQMRHGAPLAENWKAPIEEDVRKRGR